LVAYYYDNPAFLVPRQGQNVIVHWQDSNPEADAVLRDAKTCKFLCVAKHVKPLQRFTATSEELDSEARRKRAALHYARTEMRAIQPELVRATVPVPVDGDVVSLGERIAEAAGRPGAVATAEARGMQAGAERGAGLASRERGETTAGMERAAAAGAGAGLAGAGAGEWNAETKQLRGARAAVRAAVSSFGGQQFSLESVRAKLPGPLHAGAARVLHQLTMIGELRKIRRVDNSKVWQASNTLRTREADLINASVKPGDLIQNGDGTKTYVLEAGSAGAH
jgi:hypothetical protein